MPTYDVTSPCMTLTKASMPLLHPNKTISADIKEKALLHIRKQYSGEIARLVELEAGETSAEHKNMGIKAANLVYSIFSRIRHVCYTCWSLIGTQFAVESTKL